MRLLGLALLASCTAPTLPDAPTLRAVYGDSVTEAHRATLQSAGTPWLEFGFTFKSPSYAEAAADTSRPECRAAWWLDTPACVITIIVEETAFSDPNTGGATYRAERLVLVNEGQHGLNLAAIGAHEYGHVLLDTPRHLPTGSSGIMAATLDTDFAITRADRALVCETTKICL